MRGALLRPSTTGAAPSSSADEFIHAFRRRQDDKTDHDNNSASCVPPNRNPPACDMRPSGLRFHQTLTASSRAPSELGPPSWSAHPFHATFPKQQHDANLVAESSITVNPVVVAAIIISSTIPHVSTLVQSSPPRFVPWPRSR